MAGVKKLFYFVLNDFTVYEEIIFEFQRFYKTEYFGKIEFKDINSNGQHINRKFKIMTTDKDIAFDYSLKLKKEYEMQEKYNFVMNNVLGALDYEEIDKLYEIFKDKPRQFKFRTSELSDSKTFVNFESSDTIIARDYSTRFLTKINIFKKHYDYKTNQMCEGWIIKEEDLNYLHELRKQLYNKEKGEY